LAATTTQKQAKIQEKGSLSMARKAKNQRSKQSQTFSIAAPTAMTVQLVGNFTHWQERPINLHKEDGVWRATVELEPGAPLSLPGGRPVAWIECALRVPNPTAARTLCARLPPKG
jgi:1,4-alpha-glucan branching enzyme